MKIGIAFTNVGPFADKRIFETLVHTAEAVGIESIWTNEHVVIPVGYRSPYPYSEDGKMPFPENTPITDPIVSLAYAASMTRNIRLGTGVMILPQRHPLYVAKGIATLDVLSGGRAILGVGIGWLREEYESLGIPFKERGQRADEAIQAIRSLWRGEPEAFEGRFYRWPPVECQPKPVQPSGIPIVVGGQAEAAARRAARFGDGFYPGQLTGPLVEALRKECARIGRNPEEVELSSAAFEMNLDTVKHFQDLGAQRVVFIAGGNDAESVKRGIESIGERVLPHL